METGRLPQAKQDQGGGKGGGEKWFWIYFCKYLIIWGIPGGSDGNEAACNAGDPGSIPGSGRSPGEGNGNPLYYSCLENSMTEEPGGLQSMGIPKSQTRQSN